MTSTSLTIVSAAQAVISMEKAAIDKIMNELIDLFFETFFNIYFSFDCWKILDFFYLQRYSYHISRPKRERIRPRIIRLRHRIVDYLVQDL